MLAIRSFVSWSEFDPPTSSNSRDVAAISAEVATKPAMTPVLVRPSSTPTAMKGDPMPR